MHETIIKSFDIWTASQTIKSNGRTISVENQKLLGIDKLRELILELAVRGKLVPQNEKDEPASELLKKIAKEKERLVTEGKIRKQEKLTEIGDEEKPFELPWGWEWVRLNDAIDVRDGTHGTPKEAFGDSTYPLVTSKNFENGIINFDEAKRISEVDHLEISKRSLVERFDILFSMIGGNLGNQVMVLNERPFSIKNLALFKYYSKELTSPYYIKKLMEHLALDLQLNATGGAQPFVSLGFLRNHIIALPPLNEQHRIVAKVDELMALCDQLEQQQTQSNAAHQQLVELLLQNLTEAGSPAAFEAAWQRIALNFDTLFTTEYSIDHLKQTILQLAVMGKLVPQDPKDEPASELLKKIAKEKERLVKEGKIKKQEKLSEITEEEKPFGLPGGWEWVKCQTLCLKITDGEHATPIRSSSGFYLLSARNVTNEGISLEDVDFVPLDEFERIRKRCDPNIGDILISCSGSVGRIALVDKDNAYSMVRSAAMIRPISEYLLKEYLVYLLRSPFLQYQINKKSRQTAQANIFLGSISNLIFTIPPVPEQHRIVAKVDELFALCDALKARIKEAQETQGVLAEGAVEGVLG